MNHYYVYPYAPVPSYHYAPTPNHQQQLWHSNNWHPQYVAAPPATPHQHPVRNPRIRDRGKEPFVVDINDVAEDNNTFRSTIWTGKHLQATVMSIDVGDDVGLEVHPDNDQFLKIEEGHGLIRMGKNRNTLNFEEYVDDDSAIFVPAGTWHNIINTGRSPLKLYSIYAPPHHPSGTVHQTKADADH